MQSAALAFADEAHTDGTFPQKPRPVLLRERARDAAYVSDAELLFGSAEQVDLEVELADRGDPEAAARLALRQLMGLGVDADVGGAVRAFDAAAAAGDAMSMLTLGLVHTNGIGVETNHTRAKELFERAASHKLPAAYNALGHLYLNGLGVLVNTTAARCGARSLQTQSPLLASVVEAHTEAHKYAHILRCLHCGWASCWTTMGVV